MYRFYQKDVFEIMEYSFNSLSEFLDYLDNTPINTKVWNKRNLSSARKDDGWSQTKTFQEARELCKFGYHENFDKFLSLKDQLSKYIKISYNSKREYNYYVGYAPNVKAYLEGNPSSMFNKDNSPKKHVDIYYNISVIASVSAKQIYHRGIITLCLVEILESMGYSVGLNLVVLGYSGNQIHYTKLDLKKAGERLNPQKLYFPMCHPSFLRRLIFRLMEQTPDVNRSWLDGYGSPCSDDVIRWLIPLKENDIVICGPNEMGVFGQDLAKDADNVLQYISQFKSDLINVENFRKETGKTRSLFKQHLD